MFPNHQRRERATRSEVPSRVPPPQQQYEQQSPPHQQYPPAAAHPHSQPHPHSFPSQQYQHHNYPHAHDGYTETQPHSDLQPDPRQQQQQHAYSPQPYPPAQQQQQASPYQQWVPPNAMPNMQQHEQYQQQEPQHQHHVQDHAAPQSHSNFSSNEPSQEPVAGQKGYEWKPPAALQAFQTTTDPNPPPPVVETVSEPPVVQVEPPVPPAEQQGDSSGFTNFLSWAKLEDPADVADILFGDPAIGLVADELGNTFLHGACDVGNISMVQFFLKNFPIDSATSLRQPNNQGFEPIHTASFAGMLHVVSLLLKFDPSLASRRTRSGSTVLHLAIANSNFQLVDFLLDTLDNDTIWAVNNGGSNALHLACKYGNLAMIDRFAKLPGADVNFRNKTDGSTCAELIIRNFDDSMQVLVTCGAELQAKSATDLLGAKMKALYPATTQHSHAPVAAKSVSSPPTKERVAAAPVSYVPMTNTSNTSSPYSTKKLRKSQGCVPLVDEVAESGRSSPPPVASPITSPKHKTSSYFPPTNASFLPPKADSPSPLKKDVKDDSSKPKPKKISKSNSWIKKGPAVDDTEIVKVSTALQKDMTLADRPDPMPEGGQEEECEIVPEKKKDEEKVEQVTVTEEKDSVSDNVETTVVESQDSDADTETANLFKCVAAGNIPGLEAVIGVCPDILKDVNLFRDCPANHRASLLHLAAKSGSLDVAQYLVEGVGADVNALDSNNQSPLHYAVAATQLILVRYLVKYCGAVLNTKDVNGKVALDLISTTASEDRSEIERIITKASKRAPEKRMKVTIPKFTAA